MLQDQITYGDFTVDLSRVGHDNQIALMRRGIVHFLGNEQAAKVNAWAEKFKKEHEGVEASDEAKADHKIGLIKAALETMYSGAIGQRAAAGPRLDPIDRRIERKAQDFVATLLKAKGVSRPKGGWGDNAVTGDGKTFDDLVEMALSNNERHTAWKREAEREHKAALANKAAAEKAAGATGEGQLTADSLGL